MNTIPYATPPPRRQRPRRVRRVLLACLLVGLVLLVGAGVRMRERAREREAAVRALDALAAAAAANPDRVRTRMGQVPPASRPATRPATRPDDGREGTGDEQR